MSRRSTRSATKKGGEQLNYEEKPVSDSSDEDNEVEEAVTKRRSSQKKVSPKNVKPEPKASDEEPSPLKKKVRAGSRKVISTDDDAENEEPTARRTSQRSKQADVVKAEPLSDRNTEESTVSDGEEKSPETKKKRLMRKSAKPANQPSITKFLSPKSRAVSPKPVKVEQPSPEETPSKQVEASTASEDDAGPAKEQTELSEYEKQILKNIEERKKMFQMLVGDAKADFMKSFTPLVEETKEKSKPSHRGFKRKSEPE